MLAGAVQQRLARLGDRSQPYDPRECTQPLVNEVPSGGGPRGMDGSGRGDEGGSPIPVVGPDLHGRASAWRTAEGLAGADGVGGVVAVGARRAVASGLISGHDRPPTRN